MAQGKPAIIESPAGDIVIGQGQDEAYGFIWTRGPNAETQTPVPLETEGWILKAQIRSRPGSTPWLTLSSEDADDEGSVIVVNDSGEIVVYIDHATTEASEWNSSLRADQGGVWDIEAYRPATEDLPHDKKRLVMGKVTLSPDVTREAADA